MKNQTAWVVVDGKNIIAFTLASNKAKSISLFVEHIKKIESKNPDFVTWRGLKNVGYECCKFEFNFIDKK